MICHCLRPRSQSVITEPPGSSNYCSSEPRKPWYTICFCCIIHPNSIFTLAGEHPTAQTAKVLLLTLLIQDPVQGSSSSPCLNWPFLIICWKAGCKIKAECRSNPGKAEQTLTAVTGSSKFLSGPQHLPISLTDLAWQRLTQRATEGGKNILN